MTKARAADVADSRAAAPGAPRTHTEAWTYAAQHQADLWEFEIRKGAQLGHIVSVLKRVEPAAFRKADLETLKRLIKRPEDIEALAQVCGLVALHEAARRAHPVGAALAKQLAQVEESARSLHARMGSLSVQAAMNLHTNTPSGLIAPPTIAQLEVLATAAGAAADNAMRGCGRPVAQKKHEERLVETAAAVAIANGVAIKAPSSAGGQGDFLQIVEICLHAARLSGDAAGAVKRYLSAKRAEVKKNK